MSNKDKQKTEQKTMSEIQASEKQTEFERAAAELSRPPAPRPSPEPPRPPEVARANEEELERAARTAGVVDLKALQEKIREEERVKIRAEYEERLERASLRGVKAEMEKDFIAGARRKPVMGTHTYKLTERHYRQGRIYEPGETITVTDEIPGKGWIPVSGPEAAETSYEGGPAPGPRGAAGTPSRYPPTPQSEPQPNQQDQGARPPARPNDQEL